MSLHRKFWANRTLGGQFAEGGIQIWSGIGRAGLEKQESGFKKDLAGLLERAGSSGRDRDCFFFGFVFFSGLWMPPLTTSI